MPTETYTVNWTRELTPDERTFVGLRIVAAYQALEKRAQLHARLAPRARTLRKVIPNLGDLDPKTHAPLFPDDDRRKVAQTQCADCHRDLVAPPDGKALLVCPQAVGHPDAVGDGKVIDCGEDPVERGPVHLSQPVPAPEVEIA